MNAIKEPYPFEDEFWHWDGKSPKERLSDVLYASLQNGNIKLTTFLRVYNHMKFISECVTKSESALINFLLENNPNDSFLLKMEYDILLAKIELEKWLDERIREEKERSEFKYNLEHLGLAIIPIERAEKYLQQFKNLLIYGTTHPFID